MIAEDVFKSFTGNMTSALDRFVETGKLNFSDFAQSVIQDLIKIQLRMQMMQMFKSMGGGGLGGMFGSLFGGGGAPDVSSMAGYSLFADGGHITANQPALVGENGPELFIPQRSGTIVPNQQMSGMTSNQPTIVYNGPYIANMSAIDTQSATQFLAKNKLGVWSANQSASRSLPASRT